MQKASLIAFMAWGDVRVVVTQIVNHNHLVTGIQQFNTSV